MITTVKSFGGNTFDAAEYEVAFVTGTQPRLPVAQVSLLERLGAYPVIAGLSRKGNKLALLINIVDVDNVDTLRAQLFRWFDPEDETPKKLVVNSTGGVDQYVYALTEELRLYSTPRYQQAFVATLVVDGDVRWQSDGDLTDTWAITASGQTRTITNPGEDEAYPVLRIKPTSSKSGGYDYKRHVHILWRSSGRGSQYPIAITLDTATPVGAGKMQADGDDLRVYIDGVETYRWLDSMDSAATLIWFNGEWMPKQTATLKVQIAGAGAITSIEVNEDISGFPEAGALYIGSEAFVYTARDLEAMKFTGVTRVARGTSAAVHAIGAAVTWLQHDVVIAYGNATASAPTVDDDYKPCFKLDTSTNTSWVYENVFGDTDGKRAGRWKNVGNISTSPTLSGGCYVGQQMLSEPTTYQYLGAWIGITHLNIWGWLLSHPCGITNAVWGGRKLETNGSGFPGAPEILDTRHDLMGKPTRFWRGGRSQHVVCMVIQRRRFRRLRHDRDTDLYVSRRDRSRPGDGVALFERDANGDGGSRGGQLHAGGDTDEHDDGRRDPDRPGHGGQPGDRD